MTNVSCIREKQRWDIHLLKKKASKQNYTPITEKGTKEKLQGI